MDTEGADLYLHMPRDVVVEVTAIFNSFLGEPPEIRLIDSRMSL